MTNTKSPDYYYKDPSHAIFDDLKRTCIKVWRYMEEHDPDITGELGKEYIAGKVAEVDGFENKNGNFMVMINMFHPLYRRKIAEQLKEKTRSEVVKRLEAGGCNQEEVDCFLCLTL